MINYNTLDFNECRSEEVMFLLMLSVLAIIFLKFENFNQVPVDENIVYVQIKACTQGTQQTKQMYNVKTNKHCTLLQPLYTPLKTHQ